MRTVAGFWSPGTACRSLAPGKLEISREREAAPARRRREGLRQVFSIERGAYTNVGVGAHVTFLPVLERMTSSGFSSNSSDGVASGDT
jgi:hypothetical protein